MYELYSFGEQIVVMPLEKLAGEKLQSWSSKLASLYNWAISFFTITIWIWALNKDNTVEIYIPYEEKWTLIGKWGETVRELEKEFGMRISIKTFEEETVPDTVRMIRPNHMFRKKKNSVINNITLVYKSNYVIKIY